MKVKELINILKTLPQEVEVVMQLGQEGNYYEALWSEPALKTADGYQEDGYGYSDCIFRDPELTLEEYNEETEIFDDPYEVMEEWLEYVASPKVVVL